MPHITKGGKFVYGWCKVHEKGFIHLPEQAIQDYALKIKTPVILVSGSKTSAGFSITNKTMLENSELKNVLHEMPELADYSIAESKPIRNKKRDYCWTTLETGNIIALSKDCLSVYGITEGNYLLAIRSSNIAFVCIVKGPIIERAKKHPELIMF
jgi:hypothetical protein